MLRPRLLLKMTADCACCSTGWQHVFNWGDIAGHVGGLEGTYSELRGVCAWLCLGT